MRAVAKAKARQLSDRCVWILSIVQAGSIGRALLIGDYDRDILLRQTIWT